MHTNKLTLVLFVLVAAPNYADEKQILGEWTGVYQGGMSISITFGPKDKVTLRTGDSVEVGTYSIDLAKKPAHIDFEWRPGRAGGKVLTIFEFMPGNQLRIEDNSNSDRPVRFSDQTLDLKRRP